LITYNQLKVRLHHDLILITRRVILDWLLGDPRWLPHPMLPLAG
jgi:cobalamin biosynthesis protein CobD/CbiB